jgi:actin-related protein 2
LSHILPDGREIKIEGERFEAPEVLFDPSLIDRAEPGIADMVFDVIQSADIESRANYYKSIAVCGMLPLPFLR